MEKNFEDIRPYYDHEIHDAMLRIITNPLFDQIAGYLYPNIQVEALKEKFKTFDSIISFQVNVMDHAIRKIVKETSSGLIYSGFDALDTKKSYLFISNHRDILLDSAILQVILYENSRKTSEITFGENLMSSPFIIDIGKSNKMFKLIRGGTPKELLKSSQITSAYIRHAITKKHESIWIAQRNGRTKDGNDQTELAVLKMFGLSGSHDFATNYEQLNLAPLSISYEYDPCDFFKTRELYIRRRQEYVKAPNEDMQSVVNGMMQFKGGISLVATPVITTAELKQIEELSRNERIPALANLIDLRIYKHFKLWKTNYIAYDLLYSKNFEDKYTSQEEADFRAYVNKNISRIEGDKKELEEIFLGIYANPVLNFLKL
jgi:hypothetical protein